MWIFTKYGFFSVVQKEEDEKHDTLTVRSRCLKDLKSFREELLGVFAEETPSIGKISECFKADYRYRMIITRQFFKVALLQMADDLTYPNFKSEIFSRDQARESVYHRVWYVVYEAFVDAERLLYQDRLFRSDDELNRSRKRDYFWKNSKKGKR